MASKTGWHRHGTKLRHCHPMYCAPALSTMFALYSRLYNRLNNRPRLYCEFKDRPPYWVWSLNQPLTRNGIMVSYYKSIFIQVRIITCNILCTKHISLRLHRSDDDDAAMMMRSRNPQPAVAESVDMMPCDQFDRQKTTAQRRPTA